MGQCEFGSEETLVEIFICKLQQRIYGDHEILLREVDCWQGRADVVKVFIGKSHDFMSLFSNDQIQLMQNLTCANIISNLNYNAIRSRGYINKRLGISDQTISKWLRVLIKSNLVIEKTKDRYVLHPDLKLLKMQFTAYEVKLYNWKRALYQAIQYSVPYVKTKIFSFLVNQIFPIGI